MYSQCSLSLGSREKPGWTLPYGQRRVTRKWELSSLLGVQSTGSCLSSSPCLVCSGFSPFLLLHILFSLVLFHDTDFDLPSPCILHKFPFIILRDLLSPSENDKICDAPRMTKYCWNPPFRAAGMCSRVWLVVSGWRMLCAAHGWSSSPLISASHTWNWIPFYVHGGCLLKFHLQVAIETSYFCSWIASPAGSCNFCTSHAALLLTHPHWYPNGHLSHKQDGETDAHSSSLFIKCLQ